MRLNSLFAIAALTVGASSLSAQQIIKDDTSPEVVNSISEFQTAFNTVGGMTVSWTLTGACAPGACAATWGDISGVSGISGAWGIWTNSLKIWGAGSDDTFGTRDWNFWGNGITSFTMNALPGNGVFDVLDCGNIGCSTENSATGKAFNWRDIDSYSDGPESRVTYSRPIAVSPNAFVGDLYGTLKVEFGSYDCPSGSEQSQRYDDKCYKVDKWGNPIYDHGNAIYIDKVWVGTSFGSSKCRGSDSPIVNQPGSDYDNTRCLVDFSQDMDNLGRGNPGVPNDVVPEPATMTLLATGLAGMAAARRRKQAAK